MSSQIPQHPETQSNAHKLPTTRSVARPNQPAILYHFTITLLTYKVYSSSQGTIKRNCICHLKCYRDSKEHDKGHGLKFCFVVAMTFLRASL